MAVQVGAPLGDVASLTSVNIVVAAFLGRAFLGEMLHWFHVVALFCSVVGALLISQPDIIFGSSSGGASGGPVVLGYALATFSGFCAACIWVALRKATDSSTAVFTCVVSGQSAIIIPILLCTGVLQDYPFQIVSTLPLRAALWLAAMVIVTVCCMACGGTGARLCPAAVSATVSTGTRMIFGYVAQALFFDVLPQTLTLVGAALMLAGVAVMTVARVPKGCIEEASTENETGRGAVPGELSHVDDDTETDSIASFISAELVEFALQEKPVRQRRIPKIFAGVPVEQVGAAVATISISA